MSTTGLRSSWRSRCEGEFQKCDSHQRQFLTSPCHGNKVALLFLNDGHRKFQEGGTYYRYVPIRWAASLIHIKRVVLLKACSPFPFKTSILFTKQKPCPEKFWNNKSGILSFFIRSSLLHGINPRSLTVVFCALRTWRILETSASRVRLAMTGRADIEGSKSK